MDIRNLLNQAKNQLQAVTDTPEVEAEVLLAFILHQTRAYLYTWPEKMVDANNEARFNQILTRRLNHEPVSYLIGCKEFWSLDLKVTSDVLIPRPETELLVELILQVNEEKVVMADLGTGSGAITLAVATEKPKWMFHATDNREAVLNIAKMNAERHGLSAIQFHLGHWFKALPPLKFDVIVSNPPYLSKKDPHLERLQYEPQNALVSGHEGLDDLSEIIFEARRFIKPTGMLFLEHGATQAVAVAALLRKAGYNSINHYQDMAGLDRVTIATWLGYTH